MTKAERLQILNAQTIAYYSGLNGVEIKNIYHGIEDMICCVSGAFAGGKKVHCVKISCTKLGIPYFTINKQRIYLMDCIRT